MASYVENFISKMDWAKPFQRTGAFPLDRSDLFESYADAVKYAAGKADDPDSRGLQSTSYVGQIITVFENDVVSVYKIMADRTLKEVGRATNGDDKSVVLTGEILSLYGFEEATSGQQLRVGTDGKLEWFTPDTSTVEGLQSAVGALQTTVGDENSGLVKAVADLEENKANKADVYTKDEVDGKLTGALHYKGTYTKFEDLVADVTAGTITPATGDVYNITEAGGVDASGVAIKAGDNVIFNGTGWDASSGTTDLSAYYTSAKVDEELAKKVDKVEGSRLMTNAEGERLAEVSKVAASTTNGNILLEDVETTVYTLPTATADVLGGVKSSDAQNQVAVGADGKMTVNKVSADKIEGVVAEAAKTTNKITIGSKTFDGSADVTIIAEDIPLPDSVVHKTDIASEAAVGVVKGSAAQDKVSVDASGVMTVNDISAAKVKGIVTEAAKVTNKLTAGSKTFDGSAAVEITAEDLGAMKEADMDTYVQFSDIASADKAGVVKSSDAQDKVAVDATGVMTVNDISASKVKGTVSKAADAEKLGGIAAGDILVTDGAGQVKSAAAADKLAAAKDISLKGDATGSAAFDGSSAVEIDVTLKDTGTAGTYTKVTTDAKGRVISGVEKLTAADIPDLTLAKITDSGALAAKDKVERTDLHADLEADIAELEGKSHSHANETVLNGITSTKVTAWDHAADVIDNKADKATTLAGYGITDAYTKTEIDGKVAGAFHFKGSYATLAELEAAVTEGTITPVPGDVYNIVTGGGEDIHGTLVKSGDNVAWVQLDAENAGWDLLSGTMDMSAYSTTAQIDEKLNAKADKSVVEGISNKVDAHDTTLNGENGLVATVADHTTRLSAAESNISGLQTVVGDDAKGLVKTVKEQGEVITKLDGDANTTGSVRQLIAASASEINTAINNITKDGGTIDTKVEAAVTDHNSATDAHTDLFAAKQNKAIQAQVTFEVSDFVANAEGNGPALKATKAVAGLAADKSYAPAVSPAIESCAIVAAAQFYPIASVEAGVLTLYCTNVPTGAITVNGTFTEIQ